MRCFVRNFVWGKRKKKGRVLLAAARKNKLEKKVNSARGEASIYSCWKSPFFQETLMASTHFR
ncbi:unnamed protein product [Prunus armeniaca]